MNRSSDNNKSKNKKWNLFRSPEQKDLFDFIDREEKPQSLQNKQDEFSHKQIQSKLFCQEKDQIKESINQFQTSNLTFATRYHQEEDGFYAQNNLHQENRVKSQRNSKSQQLFFKSCGKKDKLCNKNSKQNIQNQQEQLFSTQRLGKDDSLQKMFVRQIGKSQYNTIQQLIQKQQKLRQKQSKTFSNHFFQSSKKDKPILKKKPITDNSALILKTLYDIKQINKQNLFINQQILRAILQKRNKNQSTSKKIKRQNNLQRKNQFNALNNKTTEKKTFQRNPRLSTNNNTKNNQHLQNNFYQLSTNNDEMYPNNHQIRTSIFTQSKKKFYLYQKPLKNSSNSKLSFNRSAGNNKNNSNTTKMSNLTKLSLNNHTNKLSLNGNTTKLSLNDRSLKLNKSQINRQSKSTIKKKKSIKKKSQKLQQKVALKQAQIQKIKYPQTEFNDYENKCRYYEKDFEVLQKKCFDCDKIKNRSSNKCKSQSIILK